MGVVFKGVFLKLSSASDPSLSFWETLSNLTWCKVEFIFASLLPFPTPIKFVSEKQVKHYLDLKALPFTKNSK